MADLPSTDHLRSERALELTRRLLGVKPLSVRKTSSRSAFLVDLPRPGRPPLQVLAKLPSDERPGSVPVEAWAYQECRRRGIHVPEVLAVSTEPAEPAGMIVEVFSGSTLWAADRPTHRDNAVWAAAGEDLRSIHEIGVAGFGPLSANAPANAVAATTASAYAEADADTDGNADADPNANADADADTDANADADADTDANADADADTDTDADTDASADADADPNTDAVGDADSAPRGTSDSWCPLARFTRAEGLRFLARAGLLEPATVVRLERRYDEAATLVHGCTRGSLLHGDLEGGHVFASGGAYQGIIDFDQAHAGDPRWDLARVPLWDGQAALEALLDGYGRDTVTEADRTLLLPLYLLAFVTRHAVVLQRSGDSDTARLLLEKAGYDVLL